MSRTLTCSKLGIEAEALDKPPYPGELGQRIFDSISKPAWREWLAHQTLLINENRLNPLDAKTRSFLRAEMERYFFGDGSERPAGYVAPEGQP